MKNSRSPRSGFTRWLRMLTASVVILSLMTSCGSSTSASKASDEFMISDKSYSEAMEFDEEAVRNTEDSVSIEGRSGDAEKAADYEDKIIRTAHLTMESDDAQKCYDTLLAFARQNGGKEIRVSKNNDSYGKYDYINIDAELKIKPEKLNEFMELAEKTDKVISSEINTSDVTQEYYDIKLRLETKKEALKSYYKLLKEASTIEEALEVQRYITDLTAEIESMEGMLKYYDSKVDLSTVHLTIRQQDKVHVGAEDDFEWDSLSFKDFLTLIKNGFLSVVNFLWSLLLWLIIIVIAISPILLIVGIVIFIIRRYRKKHPRKPKVRKQTFPAAVPGYMPAGYPPVQTNAQPVPPAQPAAPQNPPATQQKSDN